MANIRETVWQKNHWKRTHLMIRVPAWHWGDQTGLLLLPRHRSSHLASVPQVLHLHSEDNYTSSQHSYRENTFKRLVRDCIYIAIIELGIQHHFV